MTSTSTIVFGAVAILVVVAWFVFGVIDGTRPDRAQHVDPTEPTRPTEPTDSHDGENAPSHDLHVRR